MARKKKLKTTRPTPKAASPDQAEFVRLIREARAAGMALTEIADRLEKSFASVSRWEHGISLPHQNDAERLVPRLRRLVG